MCMMPPKGCPNPQCSGRAFQKREEEAEGWAHRTGAWDRQRPGARTSFPREDGPIGAEKRHFNRIPLIPACLWAGPSDRAGVQEEAAATQEGGAGSLMGPRGRGEGGWRGRYL